MAQGKTITLIVIDGEELVFNVTARAIEDHTDEVTMTKKVVPCKRFLKRCVAPEQKDLLDRCLEAGLAVELTSALQEEFQGDIKISVKKSSDA